jgi:hypothetical protein
MILQYASKQDQKDHALSSESTLRHSPVDGSLRPKHAVAEWWMTLAEVESPEANRLIELQRNALQHYTCQWCEVDLSLAPLAEYLLVADWISDVSPNCQIQGQAFPSEVLWNYIAIHTDKAKAIRWSSHWMNGKQDVERDHMSGHFIHVWNHHHEDGPMWTSHSNPLMHEHKNQEEFVAISMEHVSWLSRYAFKQESCHDGKLKTSFSWGTKYQMLTLSPTMRSTNIEQQSTVRHYQRRTP